MSHKVINKTISDLGICTRRKAEILIRNKKTLVNGLIIDIGMKINPCKNILKKELNNSFYKIVITERISKQIRRIISFLGLSEIELHPIKVGNISLGILREGELIKIESYQLRKNK